MFVKKYGELGHAMIHIFYILLLRLASVESNKEVYIGLGICVMDALHKSSTYFLRDVLLRFFWFRGSVVELCAVQVIQKV